MNKKETETAGPPLLVTTRPRPTSGSLPHSATVITTGTGGAGAELELELIRAN